jgi:hypothetical protein
MERSRWVPWISKISPKDIVSTGVGLLVGLIAGVWSVYTHFEQGKAEREQSAAALQIQIKLAEFESQRPFYQRQLDYFGDAARAAAQVATLADGEKRESAKQRFWELYWGELGIVEKGEFAHAMVQFGEALRAEKDGQPVAVHSGGMTEAAYAIAKAARSEIADAWRVDLPPGQAHRGPQ